MMADGDKFLLTVLTILFLLVCTFGVIDDRRDKEFRQRLERIEAQCK